MTLPPPDFEHWSIAARKAAVQSVRPSAFALRWKVRSGKRGGLMRASSDGKTVCHGSVAAVIRRGVSVIAAVVKVRSFMNSLRVVIQDYRINRIDKIVSSTLDLSLIHI